MRQGILDLAPSPRYARTDYVVSASNRTALARIENWRSWAGPGLWLYGPPGSGKTHLAAIWSRLSDAPVFDPGQAIDETISGDFNLLVDSIEAHIGSREREEALFHAYNAVARSGKKLLLTSSNATKLLPFTLADLKSRCLALPALELSPPDDDLLAHVLAKQFADRQAQVSLDIVLYLVPRMERSFEAARRLAREIDTLALSEQRPITVAVARRVLEGRVTG